MENDFLKKLLEYDKSFDKIVGKNDVKKQLASALMAGRHIIVVGPPGIGKTTLAKNVAELLPEVTVNDCGYNCLPSKPNCPECIAKLKANESMKTKTVQGIKRFVRVQGSPDLTAEDLIGDIDPVKAMKYGPLSVEAFTPGKIFKANNGVLFFDEVNRCPEKLQNALLQVLEERIVTIGSYEIDFNADFILIATMNPKDINTERLSEVFADRFDFIYMDYPDSVDAEVEIVLKKGKKFDVDFPDNLLMHTINFVRELRNNKDLEKVPSVRASLGLYERAQANAILNGHKTVSYEDLREAINSVIAHRISLKPSKKFLQTAEDFVSKEFVDYTEKHKLGGLG